MSVAAVMLVKDEADIIEATIRHLVTQVDRIYVADNRSTDGTTEILRELRAEYPVVRVARDPEIGYYQSRKTTALAREAHERGFKWVVPCDADELWFGPSGQRVGDYLGAQGPDVQIVKADLYNYIPRCGVGGHPFEAITFRMRAKGALPKVACRAHPTLVIEAGNHGAHYGDGMALAVGGLVVRHFSWRSPEQYLRKIRNGQAAYAATDLDASLGAHWRMFEGATDEAIMDHFHTWFCSEAPDEDPELVYDPVL